MFSDYDELNIGPSPCGEDCVQLGCENYVFLSKQECRRFIAAIRHYLGNEPEGAALFVKSNPHDFGTYYEVNCKYKIGNQEAEDYAFKCEGDLPETWEELENGKAIVQEKENEEQEEKES